MFDNNNGRRGCFIGILTAFLLLTACNDRLREAEESCREGKRLFVAEKQYNEAGQALLHSLSLQDEAKATPLLASTYEYLSRVYWEQDYEDKALAYAQRYLWCAGELADDSLMAQALNRTASCYYLAGKADTARIYYERMRELALSRRDSVMVMNACNNISSVLLMLKQPEASLGMLEESRTFSPRRRKDEFTYHYNRSRCFQTMGSWQACADEVRQCLPYADSLDLEGRQKIYQRLYVCMKNLGRLEEACLCADSSNLLAAEAFRFKQREELKNITERYQQERYETELELQRTYWSLVVVNVVFVCVVFVVAMMYRSKRRVVMLQRRMDALKVQLASLQLPRSEAAADDQGTMAVSPDLPGEGDAPASSPLPSAPCESAAPAGAPPRGGMPDEGLAVTLLLEQFHLAREMFRQRPASGRLRQLKYHTDKEYLPDQQRLPIIDSVTEVFIDPLQNLHAAHPDLTADECIYAVLCFLGCSNAVISSLTKTSEATLRKRRSRFKQKVSEKLFLAVCNPE